MTICDTSGCPVPVEMSSVTLADDERFGNLLKEFNVEDKRFALFEEVFGSVKKKLTSQDFDGLRKELLEIREESEKPASGAQNFTLVSNICECIDKLQEFKNMGAKPTEMLRSMERNFEDRQVHADYLQNVKKGLKNVEGAQRSHREEVKRSVAFLNKCFEFSMTLKPANRLEVIADSCG